MTVESLTVGGLKSAVAAAAVLLSAIGATVAQPLDGTTCRSARAAAFETGPELGPQDLKVVAVGSSSTEGIPSNDKAKVYPAALQKALGRLWPNAKVEVLNRGRGGETMAQTIARFESDVIAAKPALVIWQLGVNDVLRFDGLDGRREEIQNGLRVLADNGIPVVLLDLQYAPRVTRDADTLPMQDLIGEAARTGPKGRVFHFRRFAAMKHLAEANKVPDPEMTERDDLHMTDAMHSCVGQLLAEMIVARPLVATR
jgi:acyl-CoA thioesterase I